MKKKKNNMIFLVDDDKIYLEALKHSFKHNHDGKVEIRAFETGEECVKELYEITPNIVVLDYYLNSNFENALDGIKILHKIKKINHDIQVIMLSANDNLEVAVNSIKSGAYDYVVKNESAFVRLQHLVKAVTYNERLKRGLKKYESWNLVLAISFLILVGTFTIIYLKHSNV